MKQRYWLLKRGGMYYLQDSQTGKKESLETKDRQDAERLRNAKNDSLRQPWLNVSLGLTYLSANDPDIRERTWSAVMERFCAQGKEMTRLRKKREMASSTYDCIRNKPLIETTDKDFFALFECGGVSTNHFLRRLHNLALGLGWLPKQIIPPKLWPKTESKPKRGVTWEEHQRIITAEKNQERRLYYEMLWEVGAAQTDTAMMTADQIDWTERTLSYQRSKTKAWAHIAIGTRLEELLKRLPSEGPLFPHIRATSDNARAAEFSRRCKLLKITGVSLHSYRYAWAQRARTVGMPLRFAMEALGHNSKAVHLAYANKAEVKCPSIEEYQKKIVRIPESIAEQLTGSGK